MSLSFVLCFSGLIFGVLRIVFLLLIFYNLLGLVLELCVFFSCSKCSSSWTRCSFLSIKVLLPIKKIRVSLYSNTIDLINKNSVNLSKKQLCYEYWGTKVLLYSFTFCLFSLSPLFDILIVSPIPFTLLYDRRALFTKCPRYHDWIESWIYIGAPSILLRKSLVSNPGLNRRSMPC